MQAKKTCGPPLASPCWIHLAPHALVLFAAVFSLLQFLRPVSQWELLKSLPKNHYLQANHKYETCVCAWGAVACRPARSREESWSGALWLFRAATAGLALVKIRFDARCPYFVDRLALLSAASAACPISSLLSSSTSRSFCCILVANISLVLVYSRSNSYLK